MINCAVYRENFASRMVAIERLLDIADPVAGVPTSISKEARGLCIVLIFAAYENLIRGLCRGLLETAVRLRVSNRRLRPGLKRVLLYPILKSAADSSEERIWLKISGDIIDVYLKSPECEVNPNIFPNDGSFMKPSQVILFCEIFDLGDPGFILKEVWGRLDSIVRQRNNIAHGELAPEEVGRNYSAEDIRKLVRLWRLRWLEFIDHVEAKASTREFFSLPR